ncbi:DUF6207 family protein [Streptomyces canus]|uniref:DUF6207 family protein n=1 Tax=Streptomyces canus TaxID=58343 RepID=UPI0030E03529
MRPIHDTHVEQPGLAVVEVAAADDATVCAVQYRLAANYAIAPGDRTVHEPGELGEPGVRLRCFLDLCQEPGSQRCGRAGGRVPLTSRGRAHGRAGGRVCTRRSVCGRTDRVEGMGL